MKERKVEPICTYTGVWMYPLAPKKEDFNIADIAHALSQMTRANGHFRSFYSVAQHCLACSFEAEARGYSSRLVLALLLHDAPEAYLSDLTRPVKLGLPDYSEIEERLQEALYAAFGITELSPEEKRMIAAVDDDMLYYEFEQLHVSGGLNGTYQLIRKPSVALIPMEEAEQAYLRRFEELIKKTGENI